MLVKSSSRVSVFCRNAGLFSAIVISLFVYGCGTFPWIGNSGGADEAATGDVTDIIEITDIKTEQQGDVAVVSIAATAPFEFTAYKLEKPRRLAIEMEKVKSRLTEPVKPGDNNLVESVYVMPFEKANISRAEIVLKDPAAYEMKAEGNILYIALKSELKPQEVEYKNKYEEARQIIANLSEEVIRLRRKVAELQSGANETGKNAPVSKPEPASPKPAPITLKPVAKAPAPSPTPQKTASTRPSPKSPAEPVEKPLSPLPLLVPKDEVVQAAPSSSSEVEEVRKALESWRAAWVTKDVAAYSDYYASTFTNNGNGKDHWLKDKAGKLSRAGDIKVDMNDLKINASGMRAEVEFIQVYSSGSHSDMGLKTMTLINDNGRWKIDSENWKRIR